MNSKRLARKMANICVLLERHGVRVKGEFYITPELKIKDFSARTIESSGCGFVWENKGDD